jgi:uncharacterized protein YjbJ (UPF0337 family)
MMNIKSTQLFGVTGDWAQQAASLKEKFSHLTDVDLKFEPGKEEQLLTRLQQRLKKNRDEVIAVIRSVEPPKVEIPATTTA